VERRASIGEALRGLGPRQKFVDHDFPADDSSVYYNRVGPSPPRQRAHCYACGEPILDAPQAETHLLSRATEPF
jgi:hypothetical protein